MMISKILHLFGLLDFVDLQMVFIFLLTVTFCND